MSNFESEGRALLAAVLGKPVDYSDVSENFNLDCVRTGSANHKMGSIPAWGLDAHRRKDRKVVDDVLDWAGWYVTQPIHENETLSSAMYYRKRIDDGTYALAWLAKLAGEETLFHELSNRVRASAAWCLLGSFPGLVCSLKNDNPQPASQPHLLFADGAPIKNIVGGSGVPSVACAGMRGWTRQDTPGGNTGPFYAHDNTELRIILADVLGIQFDKRRTKGAHEISDAINARSGLPVWGLTPMDVAIAKAFVANVLDVALARVIFGWTLSCPPDLPFTVVRRGSKAVEFVMRSCHPSSNGSQSGEIINSDGTRYLFSPDNGQRGGEGSASRNHQVWDVTETLASWSSAWTSGQGKRIDCPRPHTSDEVIWRVDTDGRGTSTFWPGAIPKPTPVPPAVPPAGTTKKEKRSWWPKWS